MFSLNHEGGEDDVYDVSREARNESSVMESGECGEQMFDSDDCSDMSGGRDDKLEGDTGSIELRETSVPVQQTGLSGGEQGESVGQEARGTEKADCGGLNRTRGASVGSSEKKDWPGKGRIPKRPSIRSTGRKASTKRSISFREVHNVCRFNSESPPQTTGRMADPTSPCPSVSPIFGRPQALRSPGGTEIDRTMEEKSMEFDPCQTSSPLKGASFARDDVYSDDEDVFGGRCHPTLFVPRVVRPTYDGTIPHLEDLPDDGPRTREDVGRKRVCRLSELTNPSIRPYDERFRLFLVQEKTQNLVQNRDPRYQKTELASQNHMFLATDGSRDSTTRRTCYVLLEMSGRRAQYLSIMKLKHVVELRGWHLSPDRLCLVMDATTGEVKRLLTHEQKEYEPILREMDVPPTIESRMNARKTGSLRFPPFSNMFRRMKKIQGRYAVQAIPVFIGAPQTIPIKEEGLRNMCEMVLKDGEHPLENAIAYYHWYDLGTKHPFVLGLPYCLQGVYLREPFRNPDTPKWELHFGKQGRLMLLSPDSMAPLVNTDFDRSLLRCPDFGVRILQFLNMSTYAVCPNERCTYLASMETRYKDMERTDYDMYCEDCGYETDGHDIERRGLLRLITNVRIEVSRDAQREHWSEIPDAIMYQSQIAQLMTLIGENVDLPWPDRYRHITGARVKEAFLDLMEPKLPIIGVGQYTVTERGVTTILQMVSVQSVAGEDLEEPVAPVMIPRGVGKQLGTNEIRMQAQQFVKENPDCGLVEEDFEPQPYDYQEDEGEDPHLTVSFAVADPTGFTRPQ